MLVLIGAATVLFNKGEKMRKMLLVVTCLMLVTIVGCGTMKGIGEDFSTLGGWIKTGSDKVKNN